ncbi:MAG: hypothetical protein IT434_17765 [Phycisphaerales bacterium]|nr:hypothetical protein [Phycisphaerales bacterium]
MALLCFQYMVILTKYIVQAQTYRSHINKCDPFVTTQSEEPFMNPISWKVFAFSVSLVLFVVVAEANAQVPAQSNCAVTIDPAKIDAIQEKYKGHMSTIKNDVEARSKKIKEESDQGGPTITGHIESRRFDFKMDLPEITMVDQKMSMDLPQVTMRSRTLSWDAIVVKMVPQCRGGIDELVVEWSTCHNDFPSFDYPCSRTYMRRGRDICWDEPRSEQVRQEIIMDIPEFTMGRSEWVMGIPQITMKTQALAFDYPVFIVDDIQEKTKKDSDQLSRDARKATTNTMAAMKEEMRSVTRLPVEEAFKCSARDMSKMMRQTWTTLEQKNQELTKNLNEARAMGATTAVAALEAAIKDFNLKKQAMLKNYTAARRALNKQKAEVLKSL